MNKSILNYAFLLVLLFANTPLLATDIKVEKQAGANFSVKDLNGIKHNLSNYKGKWVLVNYWATWCPPCLEEVPDLINLYENRRKKDVMVIGVVFDYQNLKEVTDYVDDMLMTYPIVLSDNAVTAQFESVSVLPTTFIFNPQGKLVKIKHGIVTKEYIEKMIGPDS